MLRAWFNRIENRAAISQKRRRGRRLADGQRLFCSQPFRRFEVLGGGGHRGDVFFCCQNWLPRSIGNLQQKSVKEIWNGKAAQQIRRSILDGSFRYCDADVCPYLQKIDGPVQPVEDVQDEGLREIIRNQITAVSEGPSDIICCFDQSCNLSCPSCRTHVIMEIVHADAIFDIQKRLEDQALGDAKLLYITGSGDPFGSPFFRRWLQTMQRAKMPNLEYIHLHTNGLLWTERMWASIPEDTRALIKASTISIDAATPGTYAVNRRGGNFATLLKRLEFISRLRAEGTLSYVELHMTVQANNYREMPAFVELTRRFDFDRATFHKMLDWGTFSPEEYAARAVQFPLHPDYIQFLQMLGDPRLEDPLVNLSNFTELKSEASQRHGNGLSRWDA